MSRPLALHHSLLYRSDADLESYAKAIGIDGDTLTTFQTCVTSQQHKGLVEAITDTWSKRGYNGTPILVVNGKNIANPSKATLDAAVKKASASATAGVPLSGQPSIIPDTPSATASASGTDTASATPTATTAASPTATPSS